MHIAGRRTSLWFPSTRDGDRTHIAKLSCQWFYPRSHLSVSACILNTSKSSIFNFLKGLLLLLCMYVCLCPCACVCPWRLGEGAGSPGAGHAGGPELPMAVGGCWEPNSGPPQEQQVRFTTEPSLQLQSSA